MEQLNADIEDVRGAVIGRPSRYPWDEWVRICLEEKTALSARQGVDFIISLQNFRLAVLGYARLHNLVARTTVRPKDGVVIFQFYAAEESVVA